MAHWFFGCRTPMTILGDMMISREQILARWDEKPPQEAYDWAESYCTSGAPINEALFEAFKGMNLFFFPHFQPYTKMDDGQDTRTWSDVFPNSILFRFLVLLNGWRGLLPTVPFFDAKQGHFLIQVLMRETFEKKGQSEFELAAENASGGSPYVYETFRAVFGGYSGIEEPIENGIINYSIDGLMPKELIIVKTEMDKETVIEAMQNMTQEQAFGFIWRDV